MTSLAHDSLIWETLPRELRQIVIELIADADPTICQVGFRGNVESTDVSIILYKRHRFNQIDRWIVIYISANKSTIFKIYKSRAYIRVYILMSLSINLTSFINLEVIRDCYEYNLLT